MLGNPRESFVQLRRPELPLAVGVSMQQQVPMASVARRSRRWAAALALSALALLPVREAAAAPPVSRARALGEPPPPAPPAEGYSTALTLAYILAPLLALPVGGGLFELTENDAVAVVGAGLAAVALPVTVHLANGEPGRGAVSALLLPAVTLGGATVGGFVGLTLGQMGCDDSDCELAGTMIGGISGALIGGLGGYVGYAIFDVSERSSLDAPERIGVQPWVLPLVGQREGAPGSSTREVEGGIVGVTLTL